MRLTAKFVSFSILLSVFGVLLCVLSAQERAGDSVAASALTAQQIAAKMEQQGRDRAKALREFEASRVYHLVYRGFGGNKEAEMKVRMSFQAPATKSFTVVSQEGSKFIIEHVFNKLLQSEQEALDDQNRQATALTLENYEFTLAGDETQPDGSHAYILNVKPRSKNKFLYEGKIWVNAEDFGVTRIEATPSRSPSFWIKKTQIEHRYVKVGDFWLPAQNRSESQIRLGGHAVLTIDYGDYQVNAAGTPPSAEDANNFAAEDSHSHNKKKVAKNSHRQFGPSDAALADAISIPK